MAGDRADRRPRPVGIDQAKLFGAGGALGLAGGIVTYLIGRRDEGPPVRDRRPRGTASKSACDGILAAAVAALVLAGCYTPALRDCTVSCDAPGDCASGQVCGSDGMCAAPASPATARWSRPTRGPMRRRRPARCRGGIDARPDAMPSVRLTVQIMGKGSVVLGGATTCSADGRSTAGVSTT